MTPAWIPFPRLTGCPVPPETPVRIRFRNGQESRDALAARKWRWDRHPRQAEPCDFDVVAYQPVPA